MTRLTAALRAVRGPGGLARLRAVRDARASVRLAIGSAALSTGVLRALAGGPLETGAVGAAAGSTDAELLPAWLRVLEAAGLVRAAGRSWELAPPGRRLLDDPVLRAVHEAFPGYHTGLYRDLPALLAGGPARRDVADNGDVIARLSQSQHPFVADLLVRLARDEAPARVLDVGCGAGGNLVTLLRSAPAAEGTGVEMDPGVAATARAAVDAAGLAGRATVLHGELRELLARGEVEPGVDVLLYANAVYYLPVSERVAMLRALGSLLTDRGVLVVVTTAATDDVFSRHLDLELRAHRQGMELPDVDELAEQLRAAGLAPERPLALMPGALVAVLARRPLPAVAG